MNPSPAATAPNWLLMLAIIGGFVVIFPLFWCLVVWMLSRMSGWHGLARHYASGDRQVTGDRHTGVTGMVGGVSYRHVLTVHFTADGFFIEPMALFKIGQPRLFIPWSDVTRSGSVNVLWWRATRLAVGHPVVATISLPADLVEQHAPA